MVTGKKWFTPGQQLSSCFRHIAPKNAVRKFKLLTQSKTWLKGIILSYPELFLIIRPFTEAPLSWVCLICGRWFFIAWKSSPSCPCQLEHNTWGNEKPLTKAESSFVVNMVKEIIQRLQVSKHSQTGGINQNLGKKQELHTFLYWEQWQKSGRLWNSSNFYDQKNGRSPALSGDLEPLDNRSFILEFIPGTESTAYCEPC